MAFREFSDETGTVWTVWDTYPQSAHTVGMPALSGGWLTFEAGAERRRLVPAPVAWVESTEEALRQWLAMATRARLRLEEYQAREHPLPVVEEDSPADRERVQVARVTEDMRSLIERSRRTLEDLDRAMESGPERMGDPPRTVERRRG